MLAKNMKLTAKAHEIHRQLTRQVAAKITEAGGVIRFAEFMQAALYTPRLGYYQNELQTFGEAGDFITAPEMGELFAACIARAIGGLCVDSNHQILEIGAGSGALAKGLLSRLKPSLISPNQYLILEPSAVLQAGQRERLADDPKIDLNASVDWISQLPTQFNGVIIANEVLDALPCERIQKTAEGWQYLGVAFDGEQFYLQPAGKVKADDLPPALLQKDAYVEGYTTEIRPIVTAWITSLANSLECGVILLIDYGYPQNELYHPQRTQGSLRCFSRHQANDEPLRLLGLQDITAHVDFTQVAQAALSAGLEVNGFTTQSGFLLENGLLEVKSVAAGQSTYQISQQMQKLAAPGQMGELVKVIMLSKNTQQLASGFQFQDHLHRL